MSKKRKDYTFPVECNLCKQVFDFGDYLTPGDEDKHIAELVIEKCGGDSLICDKCRRGSRILDKGKFQWVMNGEGAMIPDLELISENGKKRKLSVQQVDDDSFALVFKKNELGREFI